MTKAAARRFDEAKESLKEMEERISRYGGGTTIGTGLPNQGEWLDSSTRESRQNAKAFTRDDFFNALRKSSHPTQDPCD